MLPDAIELIVVTPERQLLRETVLEVTIPGLEGELGVLPGHAPLMTELGIGEYDLPHGNVEPADSVSVIRGFAEVLPDRVTVLAETAERAGRNRRQPGASGTGTRGEAPGIQRHGISIGTALRWLWRER